MAELDTEKNMVDVSAKPKRRFIGLSVKEVSLVDSGANERDYAIIKRKGGPNMADETKVKRQKVDAAEVDDVTKADGTADNDTTEPNGDQMVLNQLVETVEKMTGALEKLTETEKAQDQKGGDDAGDGTEETTEKAGAGAAKGKLMGAMAKLKAGDTKGALAMMQEAMSAMGPVAAKKSDDAVSDDTGTDEDVEKAGAKLSKTRLAQLEKGVGDVEKAMDTLKGLLADVSPKESKTEKNADGDTVIKIDGSEVAAQITKALEPVTKQLEGVGSIAEQLKGIGARLDNVEKNAGQSQAGEGTEDVEKSKGDDNIWAGSAVDMSSGPKAAVNQ